MSEELKPSPQNEEVDLGQLFKMIGNMFQKFFDFIAKIFKGVFHVLILILAHFFKRAKWYAIAGFLGLAIGYYLDKTSEKLYGANMFIDTNFNSGYQVYENIKNLNELATEEDSIKIADILDIGTTYAAKLKGFYIVPDIDENDRIKMFSEYKQQLDSISRLEVNYTDFVESLNQYNFKTHIIGVASIDKNIYSELNTSFADAISKNSYLDSLLKVNLDNINKKIKALQDQSERIDELLIEYIKIRNNESKKEGQPGSGTFLFMGGEGQQNQLLVEEAPLLEEKVRIDNRIRDLETQKIEEKNIISVVSDFPVTGYDISEWYQDLRFLIPVICIGLVLIFFSLIGLNKFVKEYEGVK